MRKYHIIYQTVGDVAQDTIHEWAWMLDKLAYPPKPGESYTIFVCEAWQDVRMRAVTRGCGRTRFRRGSAKWRGNETRIRRHSVAYDEHGRMWQNRRFWTQATYVVDRNLMWLSWEERKECRESIGALRGSGAVHPLPECRHGAHPVG
jgi:hypothetical protein